MIRIWIRLDLNWFGFLDLDRIEIKSRIRNQIQIRIQANADPQYFN